MGRKRPTYTAEFKAEAVQLVRESSTPVREIARDIGVSETALRRWMLQDTKEGTVEHWARSADYPVGGWYGLRKGYRGRFANYISPILKETGRAEFSRRGRGWCAPSDLPCRSIRARSRRAPAVTAPHGTLA